MTTATSDPISKPFVISRLLNAPRDLVFKAWTDREHMAWWGPKGVSIELRRFELKPGGVFHYGMKTPDGSMMWGKWVMHEIKSPERLVFVNSFSDENCGLTRHPMSPTWPVETLSTITFEEKDGGTFLTVEWTPLNSTDEERKTFDEGHDGMRVGWTGTLDKLAEYVEKK